MKSAHALTEYIKKQARNLGFSRIGVARADVLTEEGSRLNEWLSRGFHGTMAWMQKDPEKRADARRIVPGAKSVISVALNYFVANDHSHGDTVGKISRYAWGDDYHIIMTPRIQSLVDCIKSERPDVHAAAYVDTGPVMDKAWAVRAGVGWLGKHTNVITKDYGSWIFLAEIIADVELVYDESLADFCGSCSACIDSCPTDAIVEPYVLDSTKCISYLTIENKRDIPQPLKPKLSNWVYGCDICQDVCPWNRFQQPTEEIAFRPRKENIDPDLHALSAITEEEFSRRFRRSPVKRTKRLGLVRNAKAVLEGQTKKSQRLEHS
jgi:epoxyqueuosine reductase